MFKMAGLVLKTIVTILVVFSVPFIIPLFLKLLLNWGAFENLEELKEIISILNNKYTLIYMYWNNANRNLFSQVGWF